MNNVLSPEKKKVRSRKKSPHDVNQGWNLLVQAAVDKKKEEKSADKISAADNDSQTAVGPLIGKHNTKEKTRNMKVKCQVDSMEEQKRVSKIICPFDNEPLREINSEHKNTCHTIVNDVAGCLDYS